LIPASVEVISDESFSKCKSLESVVFETGSKLRRIGSSAFVGCPCSNLVELPRFDKKPAKDRVSQKIVSRPDEEEAKLPTTVKFKFWNTPRQYTIDVPADATCQQFIDAVNARYGCHMTEIHCEGTPAYSTDPIAAWNDSDIVFELFEMILL
jgi:hypothetical protein